MMVGLVDEGNTGSSPLQRASCRQPAEAAPDDDDAGQGFERSRIGLHLDETFIRLKIMLSIASAEPSGRIRKST